MFLVLMKILNKHQGKMFYNLKLVQRVVTIVIRNNPDDLAKTFDKGVHLSACLWITGGCLLPMLLIR